MFVFNFDLVSALLRVTVAEKLMVLRGMLE